MVKVPNVKIFILQGAIQGNYKTVCLYNTGVNVHSNFYLVLST